MDAAQVLIFSIDEMADGDARGFDPHATGRVTMFVVRQGLSLHAYGNARPHVDGAPMPWRKDAYLSGERRRIVCHAHGAQFDTATGICVLGPCDGQALTPVVLHALPSGEIALAQASLQEIRS
jgi:nitrite reductase/ring-hydroxylating ferredoxin subunit